MHQSVLPVNFSLPLCFLLALFLLPLPPVAHAYSEGAAGKRDRELSNTCIDSDYDHPVGDGWYFGGLEGAKVEVQVGKLEKKQIDKILRHKKMQAQAARSGGPLKGCVERRGRKYLYASLIQPALNDLLRKRAHVRWLLCNASDIMLVPMQALTASSMLDMLQDMALDKISNEDFMNAYALNPGMTEAIFGHNGLVLRKSVAAMTNAVKDNATDECDERPDKAFEELKAGGTRALLNLIEDSYANTIRNLAQECNPVTDSWSVGGSDVIKDFNYICSNEPATITSDDDWEKETKAVIEARQHQLRLARAYLHRTSSYVFSRVHGLGGVLARCRHLGGRPRTAEPELGQVQIFCGSDVANSETIYFTPDGFPSKDSWGRASEQNVSLTFRRFIQGYAKAHSGSLGYERCARLTTNTRYNNTKSLQGYVDTLGEILTVRCVGTPSEILFTDRYKITSSGNLVKAR